MASVGFPIALSIYLLVRIECKLQILSDSSNELSKTIIGMK
ncbi:YvrJ family protein [Romboutsia sp. 1001216sp1]|nr:YvrJ family protein [Romboutsia sp. 1001216sp1]MDB8804417.1 YvrJ family protein [Romboutsia sp. 1001216sp1]MDB8806659.1 YvrJ family protein [Romboutsia sp. 1001216sp1]MDB8810065.1 YvrJ family protein [Romboutsia sp. 1001216sp1]MDB8815812.1 YvrJ family protein [Romboutsia sp. 1001216sp1]MDB8818262.1 YvrJ family protein [Romboutsia sp. 1001216sp1]